MEVSQDLMKVIGLANFQCVHQMQMFIYSVIYWLRYVCRSSDPNRTTAIQQQKQKINLGETQVLWG